MTAPDYSDEKVVHGMTKTHLKNLAYIYRDAKPTEPDKLLIKGLVNAFRVTWEERDKARGTAALQDKAIHKSASWVWVLERLWMAVLQAKNTGYMPKFSVVDKALDNIEVEKAKRDGSNKQGEGK